MLYVGVDWADEHHDIYLMDDTAAKLGAFRVAHDVGGVDELARRIAALGVAASGVCVAIERPDGLVVAALLQRGYAVYPINPKAAERYRERHGTSGAKEDTRDARSLANIVRTDGAQFRRRAPEGEVAAELRLTVRAHRELVVEWARLANQRHACLADYSPAALTLFGQLDRPIALDFLAAFPTPEAARAAGREDILAWLKGRGYPQPMRAATVTERATAAGWTAGAGSRERRPGRRSARRRRCGRWWPPSGSTSGRWGAPRAASRWRAVHGPAGRARSRRRRSRASWARTGAASPRRTR